MWKKNIVIRLAVVSVVIVISSVGSLTENATAPVHDESRWYHREMPNRTYTNAQKNCNNVTSNTSSSYMSNSFASQDEFVTSEPMNDDLLSKAITTMISLALCIALAILFLLYLIYVHNQQPTVSEDSEDADTNRIKSSQTVTLPPMDSPSVASTEASDDDSTDAAV
jgi:hypothetical protein